MLQEGKSENQVQKDIQNFHKCKLYIILLGFKGCGKSTFLQSLTSNYFDHSQDYTIIRYHDLKNVVQYYESINEQKFQIIKVKSRFHEQIQIDYRRKIRFIDTPGIQKLEDVETIMKTISHMKKLKGNSFDQYFVYWMCDYSTMATNLESQNILIEQLGNQKTVILINKIDKREKEDDSVMEICQQFKFKAIYKISSLWALQYNIMNYGNEKEKQLCQQNHYKKSLIQIKQSLTESQHNKQFNLIIQSTKKLIDQTDYDKMINAIQEQLIKSYQKNEQIYKSKLCRYEPLEQLSISQLKGNQICQLLEIQANFFNQSITQLKIDAYYNIKDKKSQDIKKISNFFLNISEQIELIIQKINQLLHSLQFDVQKTLNTYIPKSEVDDDIEFIGFSNYEQSLEKQFKILIENLLVSFDEIGNTLEQKITNALNLFQQKNQQIVTKSILVGSLLGCSVICSPVTVSASICVLIISVIKLLSEKAENNNQQIQDNFDVLVYIYQSFILEIQKIIEDLKKEIMEMTLEGIKRIQKQIQISTKSISNI